MPLIGDQKEQKIHKNKSWEHKIAHAERPTIKLYQIKYVKSTPNQIQVLFLHAPLSKSVHLWITLWPSLLLLLWSLRDLVMLIPSCLVVHRSIRLVFIAYSRHSLEL